jgi:hypothetical protein
VTAGVSDPCRESFLWSKGRCSVRPWWEGADGAQARCSFSNLIRYMVAKVSAINAFRTNPSGTIEDEESSFREWNCFEWHLARQREESRISVPLWKWPSGGRVEREEARTFVPPGPVVHIPSIQVVEAKKDLSTCALRLKLTAPRENVGGSIQRHFCGPFRLFSRIFVHVLHCHRCGRRELDQQFPEFKFVSHFISSPHFSCKSLIGSLLISH